MGSDPMGFMGPIGFMARSIRHNAHEQLIHPISFSHFTRFSCIVREWILEFDRPEQRVESMDQGGLAGDRVCVSAEGQAALPVARPFFEVHQAGMGAGRESEVQNVWQRGGMKCKVRS